MAHKDYVIKWLNDAYGMENALVKVLENRAKDAEGHPQVQTRIQEHIETTAATPIEWRSASNVSAATPPP